MKKLFYSFFAAVALMLSATSCSQEEMIENGTSGNEVEVSFNVDMEGQQASRAIGDGTTAKYLYFGAYLKEGDAYTYVPTLLPTEWTKGIKQIEDKKATVKLRLVKGQTYKFVFWAQSEEGKNYYDVNFAENKISAVYNVGNTASANNENRDAFYVAEEYTINGPLTETITLKRPFAQVNVGIKIGELAEAKAAGIDIAKSSFTFSNVPTELNVLTGVAGNEQKVTYYATLIPEVDKTDDQGDLKKVTIDNVESDYEYIAMNYILAGGRANITSTSFTVETASKVVNTYSVPNLPVERNYRTNIIGSIMSDAEFNIVIDPIFDGDIIYPDKQEEALVFAALNGGEVTLTDHLTLTSPLNVSADMVLNLGGKTLTGSLNLAKDATLVVNNGTIVNTDENTSGIVSNGNLTLNNVDITSARHALRIESGDVVIDGGTYKVEPISAKTLHALNVGDDNTVANVTIKNGTFIGPKGTMADSGAAVAVKAGSTVTIEDGNFSGGKNNTLSNKGILVVTGGTFDQDPSAFVAEGYLAVKNADNTYSVSEAVVVGTATDFIEALANAEDGDVIAINSDVVLTDQLIDIDGKDVTIVLNGNDLDASASASRPFNLSNGANLTINAEGAEVVCGTHGLVNMTEGTLTINGGTFINEQGNNGAFLKVNGDEEMVINLNNVTYKAGTVDSGVLRTVGENVTVNVDGGSYEAGMGFIIPNGSVKNATITATSPNNQMPAVYGGNGVTVEGCTIKSNCHAIAVSGGDVITVKNCNVEVPSGNPYQYLAFQVFNTGGTINVFECTWTGGDTAYGTTSAIKSGCPPAIINIDGVEKYRKSATK